MNRKLPSLNALRGAVLDESNLVISAAEAGQGIALADELISQTAIDAGRLLRPIPDFVRGGGYFLITPAGKKARRVGIAFMGWVEQEMAAWLDSHNDANLFERDTQ